jgi:hypothetical protein
MRLAPCVRLLGDGGETSLIAVASPFQGATEQPWAAARVESEERLLLYLFFLREPADG